MSWDVVFDDVLICFVFVAPCGVELCSLVVLDHDLSFGTRLDIGSALISGDSWSVVGSCSQAVFLVMARFKNVSGPVASAGSSPGGDGGGDPPRRLSAAEKGKGKKLATKKRKASDREGMRAYQRRAVEEQARRDRDQAAINAAIQARKDELHRQFQAF